MIQFTYLDRVDPTILFDPVMFRNWFDRDSTAYSLFSDNDQKLHMIPGYQSSSCVIDITIAEALSRVQQKLLSNGLTLKVYDAYRPQKAVDYFINWMNEPDTLLGKKYHYPNIDKKDLHELSYLSKTSSHTLGTAVDVTLVPLHDKWTRSVMSDNFLGYFDSKSLDMGVGYLCFDEQSSITFDLLTQEQKANRLLLFHLMTQEGFEPLDTEFWHFYYKRERNTSHFYDFDITDNLF